MPAPDRWVFDVTKSDWRLLVAEVNLKLVNRVTFSPGLTRRIQNPGCHL